MEAWSPGGGPNVVLVRQFACLCSLGPDGTAIEPAERESRPANCANNLHANVLGGVPGSVPDSLEDLFANLLFSRNCAQSRNRTCRWLVVENINIMFVL